MKNAFAGGPSMPQQTMNIEYTWQDRLIDWVQRDPFEATICIAFVVVCALLVWRWKK